MKINQYFSFGLRAVSAGAKLVLIAYLGLESSSELIGKFAIISTIVIVFTQIAGFEIHQNIARKFHCLDKQSRFRSMQAHATASALGFLILIPIILYKYWDILGFYWVGGALILCLEYYSTELYRYYVIALNPLKASIIIFTKNGLWILSFIILSYTNIIATNIENLIKIWILFLLVAVVYGTPVKYIKENIKSGLSFGEATHEAKAMVISSRVLMASAFAVAGVASIDKLLLSEYFSITELGNYFLLQSIASIPALLIAFTIGTTKWPKCIKLSTGNNDDEFNSAWKDLNRLYLAIAGLGATLLIMSSSLILWIFDIDREWILIFFLLVIASVLIPLMDPYKLKLYVKNKDLIIMVMNLAHLILLSIAIVFSLHYKNITFVGLSLCLVNMVMYLIYRFNIANLISYPWVGKNG